MSLSVKITKDDGNKPDNSSKVALANDAINSIFSNSSLAINGVAINRNFSQSYFHKKMITVLAPTKAADAIQKSLFEPQDYHIKNI